MSENWKKVLFNVFGALIIFSILLLMRLPIYVNSDLFFYYDEAINANQIVGVMEGDPISFYFEDVPYMGVFLGLSSIPLFWIFGIETFAYKLPGTIAFSLFILSSFWIMKKIRPSAAPTLVLLLIFTSPWVLFYSCNNFNHNLTLLLGNLMLLCAASIKKSNPLNTRIGFLLGLVMGFAIYSYSYSILYVVTIGVLFASKQEVWSSISKIISFNNIKKFVLGQKSKKMKLVRMLDAVIILFALAVLLSYVFGGFGIDVAGQTILQINKFHKAAGQLVVLIVLRVIFFREDLKGIVQSQKRMFSSFDPGLLALAKYGGVGFLIGLSPRIASIFTGETRRGGQGFDVDLNPINLVNHFWQMVTFSIPELLGVHGPISSLFDAKLNSWAIVKGALSIFMVLLILISVAHFCSSRWQEIKEAFFMKSTEFNLSLAFIVLPILICIANVITQFGPLVRYLYPINFVVAIWVAVFLDQFRNQSKKLFYSFLVLWCLFSGFNIYSDYATKNILKGASIIKGSTPYPDLVEYCIKNNINYVYSSYILASHLTFYSKGKIKATEYTEKGDRRRLGQFLRDKNEFAVIVTPHNKNALSTYTDYLEKTSITYLKAMTPGGFWVFKDFKGDPVEIKTLRALIPNPLLN